MWIFLVEHTYKYSWNKRKMLLLSHHKYYKTAAFSLHCPTHTYIYNNCLKYCDQKSVLTIWKKSIYTQDICEYLPNGSATRGVLFCMHILSSFWKGSQSTFLRDYTSSRGSICRLPARGINNYKCIKRNMKRHLHNCNTLKKY